MAGEIGLNESEYYRLKPREFERLYRGFLLREEREWERMRQLIFVLIQVNTSKSGIKSPRDIRRLPILDTLQGDLVVEDSKEHERLRKFVERLEQKNVKH